MTRYHPNGDPKRAPLEGAQADSGVWAGTPWPDVVKAIERAAARKRLARKPQQFDVSPLPLFGSGHTQKEIF